MGKIVGIAGNSGVGKSTSFCRVETDKIKILGLDPSTTRILKCLGTKELPLRNSNLLFPPTFSKEKRKTKDKEGNIVDVEIDVLPKQVVTKTYDVLIEELVKTHNEVASGKYKAIDVVVDDFVFIMASGLIDRVNESGYNKFKDTAANTKKFFDFVENLHPNIVVYVICHIEAEDGETVKGVKIKTSSKFIDKEYKLDSLFETLLYAEVDKGTLRRTFRTTTLGEDSCKAPIGMFNNDTIPNDMSIVAYNVRMFYNLTMPVWYNVIPKTYENEVIKALTTVTV